MDKKFKQQLGLIAFGVALFTALNNLNYISDFLHVCAELLTPVFAGLLMAFILSVPMRGIGKRLSRLMPKASERTINVLSLIITLLLLVAIIVLLCVIAIPQLIASVKSIISLIKEKWPDWAAVLRNYGFDTAEISAYLNKLDWKTIAEKAMNGAGVVIGSVVSVAYFYNIYCCQRSRFARDHVLCSGWKAGTWQTNKTGAVRLLQRICRR